MLPLMADEEARNRKVYDNQQETHGTAMPAQERSHARMLSLLAARSSTGWNGPAYSRLEGRHGAGAANNLRAMVLGANDGLVSTFCLIMGVAGTSASTSTLLATAVAGTLAGACSMAMGEWISVQSARELQEKQIASEAEELTQSPAEEQEELALIYQAKGFTETEAKQIAARVIGDKDSALDTLVREELGVNTTCGSARSRSGTCGSSANTSSAAPPRLPTGSAPGSTTAAENRRPRSPAASSMASTIARASSPRTSPRFGTMPRPRRRTPRTCAR